MLIKNGVQLSDNLAISIYNVPFCLYFIVTYNLKIYGNYFVMSSHQMTITNTIVGTPMIHYFKLAQ